jgi:hypothetical protein
MSTLLSGKRMTGGFSGPAIAKSVTGTGASYSDAEAETSILWVNGSPTGNATITVPVTNGAFFIVHNNFTTAYTATFVPLTGSGVTIAQGKKAIIYHDGTNFVRVTPDA